MHPHMDLVSVVGPRTDIWLNHVFQPLIEELTDCPATDLRLGAHLERVEGAPQLPSRLVSRLRVKEPSPSVRQRDYGGPGTIPPARQRALTVRTLAGH